MRWLAIFGQLISVNLVYFILDLSFPIFECHLIILFGLLTNVFLQFKIRDTQLKDFYSTSFLIYDIIQLSLLLYLTGGDFLIHFQFLIIVPTIVSSTFLSMGSTIILGSSTILFLLHF